MDIIKQNVLPFLNCFYTLKEQTSIQIVKISPEGNKNGNVPHTRPGTEIMAKPPNEDMTRHCAMFLYYVLIVQTA